MQNVCVLDLYFINSKHIELRQVSEPTEIAKEILKDRAQILVKANIPVVTTSGISTSQRITSQSENTDREQEDYLLQQDQHDRELASFINDISTSDTQVVADTQTVSESQVIISSESISTLKVTDNAYDSVE